MAFAYLLFLPYREREALVSVSYCGGDGDGGG